MFRNESFYGFDMIDSEVGPGAFRTFAIEIKHLFEEMANEADRRNEEFFFEPALEAALRRMLINPCRASLIELLTVSPVLIDSACALCASSVLVSNEFLTDSRAVRKMESGTREARLVASLLHLSPVPIKIQSSWRLLSSGVHSLLRMGLRKQLEKKYRDRFPYDIQLLSSAILKSVLVEYSCDFEVNRYSEENVSLINQLTETISLDYPLAHAFSILLSSSLIALSSNFPEKSLALVEKATELHIVLRNAYEIVPTDNFRDWLDGLQLIAQKLLIENAS